MAQRPRLESQSEYFKLEDNGPVMPNTAKVAPSDQKIPLSDLSQPSSDLAPLRPKIKVQPKTLFSNERTLLQWISAIVLLATVTIAMINLGDSKSRITGYILVPVVCLFAIYALLVFHYRLQALTYRQDSFSLRDNFGPYALVSTIILALMLSILLPTITSLANQPAPTVAVYPHFHAVYPYGPAFFLVNAMLYPNNFKDRAAGLKLIKDKLVRTNNFDFDLNGSVDVSTKFFKTFPAGVQVSDAVRNGFTYYSLSRAGTSGSVKITFQLYSTVPNFQAKPLPLVINGPKSACDFYYSLDDCNASSFFHRCDDTYLGSVAPNSVTQLETRMTNIAVDLDVASSGNGSSPAASQAFDETPNFFWTWRSNGICQNKSIFDLKVQLQYASLDAASANPGDAAYSDVPLVAKLTFEFDDNYVSTSSLLATRKSITELIYSEFAATGIPTQCNLPLS